MFGTLLGSILQFLVVSQPWPVISPLVNQQVLSVHEISLNQRYANVFVNQVFKKNILLTLAYGRKMVKMDQPVDWAQVDEPFHWELTLDPRQILSYHDIILPKYGSTVTPLTAVHFSSAEGFLSDGYIVGDGTCHLASLLAWVAKDAQLTVEAPTNHNFAPVPQVPSEHGVSILSQPANQDSSARQNLYIQNNLDHPVMFAFDYNGDTLRISAVELL